MPIKDWFESKQARNSGNAANHPIDNAYVTSNNSFVAAQDAKEAIMRLAQQQQALNAQSQYQNAISQGALSNVSHTHNLYYGNTGGGGLGVGTLGNGTATNTVPFNPSSPYTAADAYAASVGLPAMTGLITTVAFVGADGGCNYMKVDTAYAEMLKRVSIVHSFINHQTNGGFPAPPQSPMMIGDFSEDEIELARSIIDAQAENHAQQG